MALIQVNFQSNVLKRTVPVQVILPADKNDHIHYLHDRDKKYRTLYLLHGLYGNYMDWVSNSSIQIYAEEHDLAVVMPNGDNSFYVDQPVRNNDYGSFIGEELVEVMRRMFPLSRKREDTFIAGLSMGGYGALRNGLKYADTFSYVAGFSSALHIFEASPRDPRRRTLCGEDACMGDWDEAVRTDKNPEVALSQLKEKVDAGKAVYPQVFMSCGTEDDLLPVNRTFRDKLTAAGVPLTYEEAPGAHEWSFWDKYVCRIIEDWLPKD